MENEIKIYRKFKELNEVDTLVGKLYTIDPNLKKTKFGYAYERFVKMNFMPTWKERESEIQLSNLNFALEDKNTKEVLVDVTNPRGYKYTKENLKDAFNAEKKIKAEYEEKQIEIKPFISSYVPENLEEDERELLTGLIL